MNYPKEFKDKVKQVYPDFTLLHERLESGDEFVGRILNDCSGKCITNKEVLSLSYKALKELAKKYNEQDNLYKKWYKLYRDQMEK